MNILDYFDTDEEEIFNDLKKWKNIFWIIFVSAGITLNFIYHLTKNDIFLYILFVISGHIYMQITSLHMVVKHNYFGIADVVDWKIIALFRENCRHFQRLILLLLVVLVFFTQEPPYWNNKAIFFILIGALSRGLLMIDIGWIILSIVCIVPFIILFFHYSTIIYVVALVLSFVVLALYYVKDTNLAK